MYQDHPATDPRNLPCDCIKVEEVIKKISAKSERNVVETVHWILNLLDSVQDWSVLRSANGNFIVKDSANESRCICQHSNWLAWRSVYPEKNKELTKELVLQDRYGTDDGLSLQRSKNEAPQWTEEAEEQREIFKEAAADAYIAAKKTKTKTGKQRLHQQIADAMEKIVDKDHDLLLIAGDLNLNPGYDVWASRFKISSEIEDFEYFEVSFAGKTRFFE